MIGKKIGKIIFLVFVFTFISIFIYTKYLKEKPTTLIEDEEIDEIIVSNSNIIDDVKYNTNDADGNEYIITALKGEIDYSDANVIYLTQVKAIINLSNSDSVNITSDFGRYNSENLDTIFSKNVIIDYLDNKITSEYLDFSFQRNSMVISRNVVYYNLDNILKADVLEMNIKSKDTKIFMYEKDEKVNIKSK